MISVSLPANVITHSWAFNGCPNLTNFLLSGTGSLSVIENGRALVRNGTELVAYPSASGNIVMNDITSVGSGAFYRTNLTSASFPIAISIGAQAFGSCTSLTNVYFPLVNSIGYQAFVSCFSLSTLNFPAAIDVGGYAFASCSNLTNVSIPLATIVGSLGSEAFVQCSNLVSVTLGNISSDEFYTTTDSQITSNLRDAYYAQPENERAGTYVRTPPSEDWTKQ